MGKFLLHLFSMLVLMFTLRFVRGAGRDDEYCRITRCKEDGPIVRFPFWLKDQQQDHCGYPGFELSCDGPDTILEFRHHLNTSKKGLQLSYDVKGHVKFVDYANQKTSIRPGWSSSLSTKQHYNSSPFKVSTYDQELIPYAGYTLFNCSSREGIWGSYWEPIDSLSSDEFQVYAVISSETIRVAPISCTKMYSIFSLSEPSLSMYSYRAESLQLSWSTPICRNCELKGEYCKLADNSSRSGTTTCFSAPIPKKPPGQASRKKRLIAGIIPSTIFLVFVLVSMYLFIRSNKRKKDDQLKIEMFLEDYKALKPTRYSYSDIKKITKLLKDKLGQGGYGIVYKGQLSNDIFVAVKVLNGDSRGNGEEFINEVGTIGRIHHVNVVRLVGYCADGCNRALVYEFLPNNSLDKFVYTEINHKGNFLGWEKMQQIAVGIAKGIEYLHQGCAQRILHFDIKPHNILLDQNFNPKIADFGLAKLCSRGQSIVSRGTMGYIAPEVFSRNFGNVSPKSDVYSFGMLLLEMVGGKNKTTTEGAENTSEVYFPEWIFHRLEQGGEVVIQIEREVDTKIVRKLTIVGLWCIGWHPIDRPSMKRVIQMLERDECPAMPPSPFSSTNVAGTTHARSFINELEVISEFE